MRRHKSWINTRAFPPPHRAAVNVVDHPEDGVVDRLETSTPSSFPATEDEQKQVLGPELLESGRTRSMNAGIGQGLNDLATDRHQVLTNQSLSQPAQWNNSYHNDNISEDVDLKLGEAEHADAIEDPVQAPYTDGIGQPNPRYDGIAPTQHNIVVHAHAQTTPEELAARGKRLWVAIDLDNTLLSAPPNKVYKTESGEHLFGDPLPGAAEALRELVDGGARVSIYTARVTGERDNDGDVCKLMYAIEDVLKRNNIPFTDIWTGSKPLAHFFVDDKTIPPFDGDWQLVLDAVRDRLEKQAAKKTASSADIVRIYELEYKIHQLRHRNNPGEEYLTHAVEQYEQELSQLLRRVLSDFKVGFSNWMSVHRHDTTWIGKDVLAKVPRHILNKAEAAHKTVESRYYGNPATMPQAYYDELAVADDWITDYIFTNIPLFKNIADISVALGAYPTGNLSSDLDMFNYALHTAHQSGLMAEWANIDTNVVAALTNGDYIERWEQDLKKRAEDAVKDQKDYLGIAIDVEWPKGSIRSYEGDDTYVTHMKCDYGYARGVEGSDGDQLDIYLGDADSDTAFVIEQLKDDGSYDEDKVMLGFPTEEAAAEMYLAHMPGYMLGDVRAVPVDKLVNALYGEPEDRRGEEDVVPSEEMAKEAGYQSGGWVVSPDGTVFEVGGFGGHDAWCKTNAVKFGIPIVKWGQTVAFVQAGWLLLSMADSHLQVTSMSFDDATLQRIQHAIQDGDLTPQSISWLPPAGRVWFFGSDMNQFMQATGVISLRTITASRSFDNGAHVKLGDGREGVVVGRKERVGFNGYVVRITKSVYPLQVGQTVGATADGMAHMAESDKNSGVLRDWPNDENEYTDPDETREDRSISRKSAAMVRREKYTEEHERDICPHCEQVIHEKGLYYDGAKWYHRGCVSKEPIEFPPNPEAEAQLQAFLYRGVMK